MGRLVMGMRSAQIKFIYFTKKIVNHIMFINCGNRGKKKTLKKYVKLNVLKFNGRACSKFVKTLEIRCFKAQSDLRVFLSRCIFIEPIVLM